MFEERKVYIDQQKDYANVRFVNNFVSVNYDKILN